jgi:hypothetical protein
MTMRVRFISAFIAATLVLVSSHRGADTLPTSVTDQAFWKMISDFSEPGGTFVFEMFMSNEVTFQEILPDLLKRVSPGGVYLGVAPEQNFTYIAATRPKIAFILDIRRENMVEHLMYKAIFELSPTRSDFLSRLFSRPMPAGSDAQTSIEKLFPILTRSAADSRLFSRNLTEIRNHLQKTHGFSLTAADLRTIDTIANAFYRGGPDAHLTTYGTTFRLLMLETDLQGRNRNFLASDSNYQFVRQMQQKNLIVPIVGDFAGPRAMRAISGYIREHGAEVSTFYVSNVEEYIASPQSVWTSYCRNIATLPVNPSSTFIRFGRSGRGSFLGPMQSFTKNCVLQQ